jgi:uncharacterized protein (DUF697 family)
MSNQPWNPLETLNQTWQQLGDALQASGNNLQQKIEAWAEVFGQVVIPIADLPLLKPLAKIPGLGWIAATLGQVNLEAIAQTVETQRREQPNPNPEALAQQFIQAAALKAGGIGLATNFLPPLAITLFAVDMAAIATLQVELIYQMAALYDYDIQDPTRRGEVLALYACSAGGSTALKSGLSVPEVIPVIGAIIGASSDAAILWTIGQAAHQYYKAKRDHDSSR